MAGFIKDHAFQCPGISKKGCGRVVHASNVVERNGVKLCSCCAFGLDHAAAREAKAKAKQAKTK